jgi:hypothetical protein
MAREMPGGAYVMDNESFGRMMVSEQLRGPLDIVTRLIADRAKSNTLQSSGAGPLADGYEVTHGPLVVIVVGGRPAPRISNRVVNRLRYAAAREFGKGGHKAGKGTRDLRRAGAGFGDLAGEPQ